MKLTIQEVTFAKPLPSMLSSVGATIHLGPGIRNWSAIADTDTRVVQVKIRKQDAGKVVTHTFHVPFETVDWFRATGLTAGDEPAEPK